MRISIVEGQITTAGAGGLGPQAMWPGYQDTQSLAFTWWCPTTQTSFSDGVYTGSITSNVLTVTAVTSGIVLQGQVLFGTGIPTGVSVTGFISGTFYGIGKYSVSPCPNVASTTITGNAGDPDYYHVYESTGGAFTLSPGQSGTNPVLTNPGVTASNGLAPNTHNPVLGYVRNALAPGTTMQFAVKPVTAGIEGAFGPTLSMTTLVNGPSATPVPAANTSWEVALAIPNLTPVVCNTQADFQTALTNANIAGPNLIVLTAGNTFAIPNTNGYQIPAFTGTGGFTYIISSEAPEFKAGGKLPAFNANAGSPVWIIQTCTGASIAVNATSATLSAPWAQKSGWYYVWFQEGTGTAAVIEERWVVFNQGQTTIDWHLNNGNYPNPGLAAAAQTTIWVFYEPSVTPWDAFTNNAMPTIDLGAVVNSFGIQIPSAATNVRFIGINLKTTGVGAAASTTQATGYIHFSNSPEPSSGLPPTTPAESIYFDRCMAGNDPGSATYQYCAHGIGWINCNHLLVSQCYFYGIAANQIASSGDSNNFTFNGKNHLWRSTYLSTVSECHIIGGGFMDNVNPPSDIHFLNLSTHKPLGWLQGVFVAVSTWTLNGTPQASSVGANGGILVNPWAFPSGTCTVALSAESNTATFTNGSPTFTLASALTKTDTLGMNPQGTSGGNAGGLVPYWQFGREVKNHLEQKNGARVTYNGIVCRNNWVGKQAGYHGTAFAMATRDQQMSANLAINYTDCCPYVASLDVDIQNCITLNCPSALVAFNSDFQISAQTARVRYKNNLSWLSTYSVGEQMAAFWLIGPVSDVIIDQNTVITNQQVSTVGFGGALGVHFSWFNPLQGSNANMTPFSPFPFTPYQDRLTITNNIMDSSVSSQPPNPAFFQDTVVPIPFSTFPNITFNKNVTINDSSSGYPNLAATNIPYANVGFKNFNVSNLPPLDPSDWNVVNAGTANLNKASTTNGPVGSILGSLAIATTSLPNAVVGTNYNTIAPLLQATGGSGMYAWNVESAAPNRHAWFQLTAGGQPGGIPQCDNTGQFGPDTITVRCTDIANPTNSVTATFPLTITVSGAITITSPTTLPNAAINGGYGYQLIASGGNPPLFNWKITSQSGPNATTWFIENNGWLHGCPTAAGTYSVTVQAGDCEYAFSPAVTFSITVNTALQLANVDYVNNIIRLPTARVGHKYKHVLHPHNGGTGTSQTYAIVNGTLPAGLTLSANIISGTPTATGNANCSLQAGDSGGTATPVPIALTVAAQSKGVRPAGNTGTGFFVDTTGLLCDPNGFRFTPVGLNRNHFNSSFSGYATTGMNAVRYTLFTTDFRGTPAPGNPPNSTMSTYTSAATSQHAGQYVIFTTFTVPGTLNGLTGDGTLTNLGIVAAWYCDNIATWNASGLFGRAGINIANEWGPGGNAAPNPSWRDAYLAVNQIPVTSVNTSTGVITLNSSAATNPFAAAAAIGYVYFSGGGINAAITVSATTGGSSGAWTVTATTLSQIAGWTSGGTLSGGAIGMMRAVGYTEPLYIDAPGFGQASIDFINYAVAIGQSDPQQNVVFSIHCYGTTVNYACRISGISKNNSTNNTISITSASTHPAFFYNGSIDSSVTQIYVSGVQGMTQLNGIDSPTGGTDGTGSVGAWTIPLQVNTSGFGTYTGGGLAVPGGSSNHKHLDRTLAAFLALQQSGIAFQVGEFGPSATGGPSATINSYMEIVQGCMATNMGDIYWAMDDGSGLGTCNGNPSGYFYGITGAAGNGTYTVPTQLAPNGVDVVLNPRYGIHCRAAPAPIFLP